MDPGIEIHICKGEVEFNTAPPEEGMYFSPMVLALGVRLPLSPFIRGMLLYYKMSPVQLGPRSWRVALAYEALCKSEGCACDVEVFRSAYQIKVLHDGVLCFSPRGKRLITNILTIDCNTPIPGIRT